MRKLLIAAGVAALCLIGSISAPSAAMAGDYAAIAASPVGWGSAEGGYRSMESARR